jgi:hypothetical protein
MSVPARQTKTASLARYDAMFRAIEAAPRPVENRIREGPLSEAKRLC